jgi:hypothetical protein
VLNRQGTWQAIDVRRRAILEDHMKMEVWQVLAAYLEEQYSKVVGRKSRSLVTAVA